MFAAQLVLQLVVPQLFGIAMLYWAGRRQARKLAVLAPFVAAAIYLVWSWAFWSAEADAVEAARGMPACGAFGAMMLFATFGGALMHLVVAALVAGVWHIGRRMRSKAQSPA